MVDCITQVYRSSLTSQPARSPRDGESGACRQPHDSVVFRRRLATPRHLPMCASHRHPAPFAAKTVRTVAVMSRLQRTQHARSGRVGPGHVPLSRACAFPGEPAPLMSGSGMAWSWPIHGEQEPRRTSGRKPRVGSIVRPEFGSNRAARLAAGSCGVPADAVLVARGGAQEILVCPHPVAVAAGGL